MSRPEYRLLTLLPVLACAPLLGQRTVSGDLALTPPSAYSARSAATTQPSASPSSEDTRSNHILRPNDRIQVRAPQVDEIDGKEFGVAGDGNIVFPLLGTVHVAGRSDRELEADLVKRLAKYVHEPRVSVNVA